MPSAEQEALSQSEYKRGVSAWNFDIEDLKIQASLIREDEDHPVIKEIEGNLNEKVPLSFELMTGKLVLRDNAYCRSTTNGIKIPETRGLNTQKEIVEMNLPSINIQGKNKVCKLRRLRSEFSSNLRKDTESNHSESDMARKSQPHSGPVAPVDMLVHSTSDKGQTADRFDGENQLGSDKYKRDIRKAPSVSGPLILQNRASANSLSAPTPAKSSGGYRDLSDEKSKVQIKGRFSVTSENVDIVKDVPICAVPRRFSQSMGFSIKEATGGRLLASILVPHLQNLYQQTSFQLDLIMNMMNSLQQTEQAHGTSSLVVNPEDGLLIEPGASDREQLLLLKISEMQARVCTLTDELTAAKVMQFQLQQQLSDAYS